MEQTSILEKAFGYFTGHPDGQRAIKQLEEDARIKEHLERQRNSQELADATVADLKRIADTDAKRAPLVRRLETLQAEQRKVEAQLNEVEMVDRQQGSTLSRRMDRARGFLERKPQPELAPFLARLNEELDAVANRFESMGTKLLHGRQQVIWCNDVSVKGRLEAIVDTIKIVRGLAIEPIHGAELDRKLDELWCALPAIEPRPTFEEAEAQWNRGITWGRSA